MSEPILRVTDLRTHFRLVHRGRPSVLRAVDGVSFELQRGQSIGIVGESGSGKSTVARTIVGLEQATSGSITIGGQEVIGLGHAGWRGMRKKVQMVFQDPFASLNPRMQIGDLIGEALRVHAGATKRAARQEAAVLLDQVGLPSTAVGKYPHEFSGGQRQRVSIARALAVDPELIVADEPVSALDVSVQAQLLNLLRDLQESRGLSYVFISHDLNVVRYMCETTAVMYLGEIVEKGNSDRIWHSPEHPYTRALLSAVPGLGSRDLDVERALVRAEPPSPVSPPPGCRFHTRCPVAEASCSMTPPPRREVAPDHIAACIHAGVPVGNRG